MGNQIIAHEGWGRPTSYADVLRTLGDRGILPSEFSQQIVGMAGLRNILVHGYLDVDLQVLIRLARRSNDFTRFAAYILDYLEGRPSES